MKKVFFLFLLVLVNGIFFAETIMLSAVQNAKGEIVVDNSDGDIEDRIRIINNTDSNVEVVITGEHKRKGKILVATGFVKASDTEFLSSSYDDALDDFRNFTVNLREGVILSFSVKCTSDDLYVYINKMNASKSLPQQSIKKDVPSEIVVDNSDGNIEDRIRIINNTDSNVEVVITGEHKRKGKILVSTGFVKASDTEFLSSNFDDGLDDFRNFSVSLREGKILSFSTEFTRDDLYFYINKTDIISSQKNKLPALSAQSENLLIIKVFFDYKNYSQLREKDKNLFYTAYLRCLQDMTIVPEINIRSDDLDKSLREIQKKSQIEASMGLGSESSAYAGDKGSRADLAMNISLNKSEGDLYQIVFTVSEIEKMNLISVQVTNKLPMAELTDNKVIDEATYKLLLDLWKRNYIAIHENDIADLLRH